MAENGTPADPFGRFREQPGDAAVLVDFDGTLATIVDDPGRARPLGPVPQLLGELAERYLLVAVLSGRPVAFLRRFLPASVVLSGLYGLEVDRHGTTVDHPDAGPWRPVVAGAAARAETEAPDGVRLEPKGLSLTVHYRTASHLEPAVRAWAEREAARTGLIARPAKMSVELHPPLDADKGSALRWLAAGIGSVCYLGDDIGDLPAFDALDDLAEAGAHTVRVAVASTEAPDALVARADVVVDGPEAAYELLRTLLG